MIKDFTKKETTTAYNRRVGSRIKIFREIRGMDQKDLYPFLGYKSTGAGSLIESGVRGLNKTKLKAAAAMLGTYTEILTDERALSKDELIILNRVITAIKDTDGRKLKKIMDILND